MSQLAQQKCEACGPGTPTLSPNEIEQLMGELADAWEVREGFKLSRRFKFKDFLHAFGMASQVALLAQEEGHHPDMTVGWGYVGIELTTHAAGGLTKNDFVFAAKVDQL